LSIKLDSLLPGTPTIPEQIAANKDPSLEDADKASTLQKIDVSALEGLVGDMLAQQLLNAAKEAAGEDVNLSEGPVLH
jgi:hypothetical protein